MAGSSRPAEGSHGRQRRIDPALRPRLRPGLPRVWRDSSTLQVGLTRASGAVVCGLLEGDDVVVAALDGTRTIRELHAWAADQGIATHRVDQVVRVLRDADLLVRQRAGDRPADRVDLLSLAPGTRDRLRPDAQAWTVAYPGAGDGTRLLVERGHQHVRVEGDGRVAAGIATTLASAGVGTVTSAGTSPVLPGDVLPVGAGRVDVGSPTAAAVHHAVSRVRGTSQPGTLRQADTDPADRHLADRHPADRHLADRHLADRHPALRATTGQPDLTVLVADDVLDSRRGDDLLRHDVPHLAVVASLERVVIGPLVLPGSTPCLRCLDLHRRDRDPAWPQVVAQLLSGQTTRADGRAETASATAAAGLAALQVLVHLDGHSRPVTVGRTLELTLPGGLVERRTWRLHPSCGCARPLTSWRVSPRRSPA